MTTDARVPDIRFALGYADAAERLPLDDPPAGWTRELPAAAPDTPAGVTATPLGLGEVFAPHRAGDDDLRRAVLRRYTELDRHGAAATVAEAGR